MTNSHTYKALCKNVLLNRAAVKTRHSAPDTVPPSQGGRTLFCNVSVYCQNRYNATNFDEQGVAP